MRRYIWILVWLLLLGGCATPRLEQKAGEDSRPSPVSGTGMPCLLLDW